MKQVDQFLAEVRLMGQLQQRTAGRCTHQWPGMVLEGVEGGGHLSGVQADVAQGLQQGFTGFAQTGASALFGSCLFDATAEEMADGLDGCFGSDRTQAAGGFFANGVIVGIQELDQCINGRVVLQQSEGANRIQGHTALIIICVVLVEITKTSEQQGECVWMP